MKAPLLYRTRIGHVRRSPIHHAFEYRSYSWFVDLDDLPAMPWWLRPFARFDPADHFDDAAPGGTLRQRLDGYLDSEGIDLGGGHVTALLGARVLGHVFDPLTLFWCHGPGGALVCVVAEVHNTYGGRHCYLLRPDVSGHAEVDKAFYVSPFNPVDGRYTLRVPEPGRFLDVEVTLHRDGGTPFTASMRGSGRPATTAAVALTQITHPLAPQMISARIRRQGIELWLRRLPLAPRPAPGTPGRLLQESAR